MNNIKQPKIRSRKSSDITSLKLTGNGIYDVYVREANKVCEGKPLNINNIKEYFEYSKTKYKPSTLVCLKAAIKKSIIKTFERESRDILFLSNIDLAFKDLKVGKGDTKIYSEKVLNDEEINRLITSVPVRLALIIKILSLTGLRVSELINIKKKDCRIEKDTVFIKVIGKRMKQRRIFIPVQLYHDINNIFQGHEYLFETVKGKRYSRHYLWREIKDKGSKVLGRGITPHSFRHSFCTNMLIINNKSLKAVSLYVGHSSTSITSDMYIHDELKPSDVFG